MPWTEMGKLKYASSVLKGKWFGFRSKLGLWQDIQSSRASLVPQSVKNLPTVRETRVQSLGWEDPLEEGMVTHSSTLVWRIPMDRGAWRATVHGHKESDTTEYKNLEMGSRWVCGRNQIQAGQVLRKNRIRLYGKHNISPKQALSKHLTKTTE